MNRPGQRAQTKIASATLIFVPISGFAYPVAKRNDFASIVMSPMKKGSRRETCTEQSPVESVNRRQPRTSCDQGRKRIGCILNLLQYILRIFLALSDDDENRALRGAELVMRIRKFADDLFVVETSGMLMAPIRTGEQRDVKAHSVGAINERSLLSDSDKCPSAVRALNAVFLQRSTPAAGTMGSINVSERAAQREQCGVRKTPLPEAPQLHETTWVRIALWSVRKPSVFRIARPAEVCA